MRELILHIGMHKTGTTSIQSSLSQFDNGSVRAARLGDVNHSVPMFTFFSEDRYDYHVHRSHGRGRTDIDAIVEDARDCLIKELSLGRDRLIISGEDIALIDSVGVDTMATFLEQHVDNIRVLAYVRDPIGFASSALQQRIRGGQRRPEIPATDYRKRFEKFVDRFGQDAVEFVGFSKSALNGTSVVQDFCNRVGIDHSSFKENRTNISSTLDCIRMLFLFNRAGLKSSGTPQLVKTRNELALKLSRLFDGPDFRIPSEIAASGIDWDDVAWMEKASGLSLSDARQGAADIAVTDDPLAAIESLLTTVDPRPLRRLKALVAQYDQSLAETNSPEALLNALYVAIHLLGNSPSRKSDADEQIADAKCSSQVTIEPTQPGMHPPYEKHSVLRHLQSLCFRLFPRQ